MVYFTAQEGLWGTAEETILFYQKVAELLPGKEVIITQDQEEKLKATIEKVIFKNIFFIFLFEQTHLQFVILQMRVWSDPNHVPLTERWNSGVIKAVKFLDSVPEYFTSDSSPIKSIEEKARKFIG